MTKITTTLLIMAALTGCSATIKESSFIHQDQLTKAYSEELLADLDNRTPNHFVKHISTLTTQDDITLHGLHLDNPNTSNTVLFVPGNGMSVEKAAKKALEELARFNADLVIFDRRGLGATKGSANITNLISDANLTFDYVKGSLGAGKVIVHGFSLGSFIAAQVAKSKPVDALVMQGSATNVDDWIEEAMPWYTKVFVNIEVDEVFHTVNNEQVVKRDYAGPLLVIGGEQDKQTPAVLSQKLFDASQSSDKQIIIADEAKHNQMFQNEQVKLAYKTFIEKI